MHQIQFRLGLRSRPRWGAYSAPPDPLAAFIDVKNVEIKIKNVKKRKNVPKIKNVCKR